VRIGAAPFALGLPLMAFVAHQLWGPPYKATAQSHLKSQLSHELHRGGSVGGPARAVASAHFYDEVLTGTT
jgi:hypothetical protein